MTALDRSAADHVLVIPEAAATSFAFGDYTLTPMTGSEPHPVEQTEHGFWAIPRGSGVANVRGLTATPAVPAGVDDFVFIMAFDQVDSIASGAYPSMYSGYATVVFTEEDIQALVIGGTDQGLTAWPTPTPEGVFVVALINNSTQTCAITSLDGIISSSWAGEAGNSAMSFDPDGGGDENSPRLLGMWVWEGIDAAIADVSDTVEEIRAELSGEGGGEEGGTYDGPLVIGPAYRDSIIGAVIGPQHSTLFPDTMWGAFLDDTLAVIQWTNEPVPHDSFAPGVNGQATTADIEAGVAETGFSPAFFGLYDAPEDGNLIIAGRVQAPGGGAVSFEAGDTLIIPAGTMTWQLPTAVIPEA